MLPKENITKPSTSQMFFQEYMQTKKGKEKKKAYQAS